MANLLLAVIYLAFVSLGLPDAMLGAAWPTMYHDFGVPVSFAGGISMVISAGTIVSALLAAVLFVPVSILLTQFFPFISTNVGLYLPILIVDSLILTKCDLYIELGVRGGRFLDMLCTGLGFTLLICLLGALRELLAYGTLWGKNTGFPPVSEAVAMPFFGFFVIGLAAAGFRYCNNSFRHWINKKEEE